MFPYRILDDFLFCLEEQMFTIYYFTKKDPHQYITQILFDIPISELEEL